MVKETNRLKTLNSHLEYRLNEQEKRLSAVSLELTKTWHLVGKMQRQHRQLHTQEQILRYQLQQKRRLLSELKEELEYCRRKWAVARAKNDESQEQCNEWRREFARRKLEDANNSAESGYSDSGPASDEEEKAAAAAGSKDAGSYRRRHLREMFEHTRKIKRMQSTSPGRAAAAMAGKETMQSEVVLRWNSAPPTCGWHRAESNAPEKVVNNDNKGAVPKRISHASRSRERHNSSAKQLEHNLCLQETEAEWLEREDRAERIQRLEEQCKSLIQQVLETSDNREKLEIQLCRFQDEIAPVQYAVPLDEFINRKRIDRMARASSAPAPGALTPREEEYTRKRSERLERLEEESRQLMSRIKRTSDRGHYLRCSLDRMRRAPSRDDSVESNTEEDSQSMNLEDNNTARGEDSSLCSNKTRLQTDEEAFNARRAARLQRMEQLNSNDVNDGCEKSPLTAEEEAYTARRAARLQRMEEESKQLLASLSRNVQRGENLETKLDVIHEQHSAASSVNISADGAAACNVENEDVAINSSNSAAEITSKALGNTIEQRLEDIEKISSQRQERLRLLEEQGKQLLSRLSNTSQKGTEMINRIAEREKDKQARLEAASETNPNSSTDDVSCSSASLLIPTPKNVACSSIVGEELEERVTVTTTPSRLATTQGAIPKNKPESQLNAAARQKETAIKKQLAKQEIKTTNQEEDSLENLVKRLREVPFPNETQNDNATENQSTDVQAEKENTSNETSQPDTSAKDSNNE